MTMTTAMREVMDTIRTLPAEQQDELAAVIREEIAAERRWDELFADPRSEEILAELAAEARNTPESELGEGW